MTGAIPEHDPSAFSLSGGPERESGSPDSAPDRLSFYLRFDLHTRLAERLPDGDRVTSRTVTIHLDVDAFRRAIDSRLAEMLAGDGVARLLTPVTADGCVLFPASGLTYEATPYGAPSGTTYVGLAGVPPGWTRLYLHAHVECPQSPKHWSPVPSNQADAAGADTATGLPDGETGVYGSTVLVALFTVQPTVPNRLNVTIRYLVDIAAWVDVIRNEVGQLWVEAGSTPVSDEPIPASGTWSHLYSCQTCAGWVAVAHNCVHSTPPTKSSWVALAQRLEIGVSTLHRMRRDHEKDAGHEVPAAELMVALAPCEFCRQPEIGR